MEDWQEISRDPSMLTAFIHKLGVKGCEIEEVFNFEMLEDPKHVYGIILLYSWSPKPVKESLFADPDLCFLNFIHPKTSVTSSLLTVLFNSDINLGSLLSDFKTLISPLPAKLKAVALHNNPSIRSTQNLYSEPNKSPEFFTCYLPRYGKVVELDGFSNGPVYLGDGAEEDWLERAKHALSEKISAFNDHNIEFSVLAVVKDRAEVAENSVKSAERQIAAIKKKLGGKVADFDSEFFEGLPEDKQVLTAELASKEEIKAHHETIGKERSHLDWSHESSIRTHNYIPFIASMLKKLEEKKQLGPLITQALKKKQIVNS